MVPDSLPFLLIYLLVVWVIPPSVLGIVAGGLTRLILGRQWSLKAAIGDAPNNQWSFEQPTAMEHAEVREAS